MAEEKEKVDGLRVVAIHPVKSPLWTEEKQVYFNRMERLELEFDNEVYRCRECGYTAPSVGTLRTHLGSVHPSKKALQARKKKQEEIPEHTRPQPEDEKSPMDYTIGEVLGLATENSELREENTQLKKERDDWKTKAYQSEKSLRKIREALK